MPSEFPYRLIGKHDYPIIPVSLRNGEKSTKVDALIDSGAVISVFQTRIAEELQINWKMGTKADFIGANGVMRTYLHKISINILGKEFECEVGFSKELGGSPNLLGRRGFFENHKITFLEREKKIVLEEAF